MLRVAVKPEMLKWARERAGLVPEDLVSSFPRLGAWESGDSRPTLRQVEDYARFVRVPVGFLFLPQPPIERIPIPDFRAGRGGRAGRPSPELLDMLYVCQQRQEWYRDYALSMGEEPLRFVGAARLSDDVSATAASIREELGFDVEARARMASWSEALRRFAAQADALGVLVMCSGVVLNNTHRRLDPAEFRGFAMSDAVAPLVFVNGADSKAAQMFTLAHELAHLWLGQSAVSDAQASLLPDHEAERWCNQVAAETLVPMEALRGERLKGANHQEEAQRLARRFKVSTLVILRRLFDAGALSRDGFWQAYEEEAARLRDLPLAKGAGGDFHLTEAVRVGKRFARALVASTLEGRTLHRDAFRLLGISKLETFQRFGQSLGVV